MIETLAGTAELERLKAEHRELRRRYDELAASSGRRIAFLSESSRLLSCCLDVNETLRSIARLAVPGVADSCVVDFSEGCPPEGASGELVNADSIVKRVLATGKTEVARGAGSPGGDSGATTVCVPLIVDGKAMGAITMGWKSAGRAGEETVELAEELGRRASMALQNARLYRAAASAEERYRLAHLAMRDVVWEWDLASGIAGPRWSARLHPEDRRRVEKSLRVALDSQADQWSGEYRFLTKEGSYALMLDRGVIARDRDGKAYRMVGAMTDVTATRRAEAALRARYEVGRVLAFARQGEPAWEELLRALCETMGWKMGVFWKTHRNAGVLRRKALWTRLEAEAADFAPLTLERGAGLPGRAWSEERPVWDSEQHGEHGALCFPAVGAEGVHGVLQFLCDRREEPGSDLWALCRCIGREIGQFVERMEAEQDMRRHQAENRIILDSVHAMIWYKDKENRILRCNRAAAEARGMTVAQMEGSDFYALYPDETPASRQDDLEVIRSGRAKLGGIERITTRAGEKRWVSIDKVPYRDQKGRIIGVIVFALDVTDQKKAQDVLRESELAQQEFVANVSHELRTPVAAIKGFAETLRMGAMDDLKRRAGFLRLIESNADRLAWLIEDILTLSSLNGGRELTLGPVALRELAVRYARSMAAAARSRKIVVKVGIAQGLRVLADAPHLLQVLENLYSNALKFNRPGGRVWITARRQAGFVRLTVRDDGIGIAADNLRRVFDRFYRVKKGASAGDTGLGLHIVKTIVEAHGGRAWAQSAPGKGSAFHVTLPVAKN